MTPELYARMYGHMCAFQKQASRLSRVLGPRAVSKSDAALHALPRMAPRVTEWGRLVTNKQRQHNPTAGETTPENSLRRLRRLPEVGLSFLLHISLQFGFFTIYKRLQTKNP